MMIWVDRYCWFYPGLSLTQQHKFQTLLIAYLSETKFEGVGIKVTSEMKVAIGGWAVLLVLNLPLNITWYNQVERISIYPGSTIDSNKTLGQVLDGIYYCYIEFAWEEIKKSSTRPEDNGNTILHEFAHALDSIDRSIDGQPNALISSEKKDIWSKIFCQEYIHKQPLSKQKKLWNFFELGRWNKFDPNDSSCVSVHELFAVSTEFFFEKPSELLKQTPEIYGCLKYLYKLDPINELPKEKVKQSIFKKISVSLNKLIRK